MYVIHDNGIVPVVLTDIVTTGQVLDARIAIIEKLVADEYDTTVHELDVFYRDSKAKVMCCFLLHDCLHYSIGSIGKKYNIFPMFLQKKINEIRLECLTHPGFMDKVLALKDAVKLLCDGNL